MSVKFPARALPSHFERFRQSGLWSGGTVTESARQLARSAPDSLLFVSGDNTYRAAQLYGDADALAAALNDRGVTQGTVVSFQLPNWPEAAVINLACAMLGAVVMPIAPIYRDAEVGEMLRDSGSLVHFSAEHFRSFDYAAMLERLRANLPELKHVVIVRGEHLASGYSVLLGEGRSEGFKAKRIDSSSVKLLLYTSGTTGRAKGVLHSHDTLGRSVCVTARQWNLGAAEAILMASPVTHLTGFLAGLELPFICGTCTVLMEKWDAASAVRLIEQHRVVGSVSATPFLQELADAAQRLGTCLPSLRFFACGGAPVPPNLVRHANRAFAQHIAFRIYGSSETPMVTQGYSGEENAELAATTDGQIVDYEVMIVDEEDIELPQGTVGEILVRGPEMFLGYADPTQTADAMTNDGFFRTGDLGRRTSEGALIVTGRKKDLIIRGGEKLSPQEIEDVLYRHPGIAEAAVVAMPHPRLGEGVCAYVVPRAGHDLDSEAILAHVRESGLATQKYPERIEIVGTLPKTPSGKIRKDLLRERAITRR